MPGKLPTIVIFNVSMPLTSVLLRTVSLRWLVLNDVISAARESCRRKLGSTYAEASVGGIPEPPPDAIDCGRTYGSTGYKT